MTFGKFQLLFVRWLFFTVHFNVNYDDAGWWSRWSGREWRGTMKTIKCAFLLFSLGVSFVPVISLAPIFENLSALDTPLALVVSRFLCFHVLCMCVFMFVCVCASVFVCALDNHYRCCTDRPLFRFNSCYYKHTCDTQFGTYKNMSPTSIIRKATNSRLSVIVHFMLSIGFFPILQHNVPYSSVKAKMITFLLY